MSNGGWFESCFCFCYVLALVQYQFCCFCFCFFQVLADDFVKNQSSISAVKEEPVASCCHWAWYDHDDHIDDDYG